jgi:hypothetical protein
MENLDWNGSSKLFEPEMRKHLRPSSFTQSARSLPAPTTVPSSPPRVNRNPQILGTIIKMIDDEYRPGQTVPQSGIYAVLHDNCHGQQHEVTVYTARVSHRTSVAPTLFATAYTGGETRHHRSLEAEPGYRCLTAPVSIEDENRASAVSNS